MIIVSNTSPSSSLAKIILAQVKLQFLVTVHMGNW